MTPDQWYRFEKILADAAENLQIWGPLLAMQQLIDDGGHLLLEVKDDELGVKS